MEDEQAVVSAIREADGVVLVHFGEGEWRPIEVSEEEPQFLADGHKAVACLRWRDGSGVLLTLAEGQPLAFWPFDANLKVENDQAQAVQHARAGISAFATDFTRRLYQDPLWRHDESGAASRLLRVLGPDALRPLFALSESPRVRPLTDSSEVRLTTDNGPASFGLAGLARLLMIPSPNREERNYTWLAPAAEKGRVLLPAISSPGMIDLVYYIGRWGDNPIYWVRERQAALRYFLIQRPHLPSLLYFPDDHMLISRDHHRIEAADVTEVMMELGRHVSSLAACKPLRRLEAPWGLAVLTYGVQHVGHAIWDEMSALDAFLDRRPAAAPPAQLYLVNTGVDFYGPVETIYPEFAGRITRAPWEAELAARAMERGLQIVPVSGHVVLQSTRRRIAKAVDAYATAHSLQTAFLEGAAGPIIVFQIRLTNRCPEDSVGVYARLAHALLERFGALTIVVDGINGTGEPGRSAGPVFNGAATPDTSQKTSGSAELLAEEKWVASFRQSLLDSSVSIVSCVGRPLLENLFWLSRAAFFVAPIGAGLAKLRWAQDRPGFVVTSQVNARNYYALTIFGDEGHMEPPFSPMYYSDQDDVIDLPMQPPRYEPPRLAWGIPHPENFRIREDRLFPKIVKAAAETVGQAAPGRVEGRSGSWLQIAKRRLRVSP